MLNPHHWQIFSVFVAGIHGYHDLSDAVIRVAVFAAQKPLVPCGYLQGPHTERSPHLCPMGI